LELPDGTVQTTDDDSVTQTDSGVNDVDDQAQLAPENDDKTALLNYAASQGIDGFTDDHELSDMIEALKGAELEKVDPATLRQEEIDLLERLELAEVLLEKPKAKKAVVVAKKSTAPAKPVIKGKGKK
jgi:hypothetical protein